MLRAKRITPRSPAPVDPSKGNPLRGYERSFLDWTETVGLSKETARIRAQALDYFIRWCDERSIRHPSEVTRAILERYQRYLFHYRKKGGDPLAFSTQATRLNPLKAFFKWLARERHIAYNPASELIMPKLPRRLPQYVLTIEEVERVLSEPDCSKPAGIRDRAMMELLYSTGLRRMELAKLKVHDLNMGHGTVMVRGGKGGKDRMVPMGSRAAAWVSKYLADVRPMLAVGSDDSTLFLTDFGESFVKNRLGDLVKRYIANAGVPAPGACHLFRHACATHMLENGADIRFIQAMLGHSQLSTTEIYTQVSISKLKEIHAATHPAKFKD